ncbi:MAG TPA: aspartate kinase, partial [Gemmatimonadales bacterium]|nr:aspartate kinase [Gemmatimonadales bacterium]
ALESLLERHGGVARELPGADAALAWIERDAAELRRVLDGIAGRGPTPREYDAIASRGELWSSRLVAAALAGAGLPAEWVDARSIVVTDDRFTRATPDLDRLGHRARERLLPPLEAGRVPVTQGFIGATADGVPTTLGRGGSDFSASLLGAALGAARVEIWTDVDGLMSADPRIVPSAHTLPMATYEEAAELATFGAKVLHPATQLPLAQAGIPIVVLNSARPEHPGTTIAPAARLDLRGDSPVRAITWKQGITVINVRTPRMLGTFGYLRRIFEVFERHEVVVDVIASTEVSVSLTIDDGAKLAPLARDLSALGEVTVDEHRAIVSVVGAGMRHTPGMAARVFAAVRPANVEMISQGASEISITFVVRAEEGRDVVRRLHREFFGAD